MTIATQNGSIIVKDGKASCECCETGCCGGGESLASLSVSVTISWTYNTNPSTVRQEFERCWPTSDTTQARSATWDELYPANLFGDGGICTKNFYDLGLAEVNIYNGQASYGLDITKSNGPAVAIPPLTNIAIAPVAGACQLSFYTGYSNPGCFDSIGPLQMPFMTWEYAGPGTYTLTYYVWSLFNRGRSDGTYTQFTLRNLVSRNSLSAIAPPVVLERPLGSAEFWSITNTAHVVVTIV